MSSGAVHAPTTALELVSDPVDNIVQTDERYICIADFPAGSSNSMWMYAVFYDANDAVTATASFAFNNKVVTGDRALSVSDPKQMTAEAASGTKFRISFRTFGDAKIWVVSSKQLMERLLIPYNIVLNAQSN